MPSSFLLLSGLKRRHSSLVALLTATVVLALHGSCLWAQRSVARALDTGELVLPESPGSLVAGSAQVQGSTSGQGSPLPKQAYPVGAASVSGAVVDSTGGAIPTALIVLNDSNEVVAARLPVNERGGFVLRNLPSGQYRVTVEAPGFQPLVAPTFHLNGGQAFALGSLELAVASNRADVEVNVTEHSLAEEQMKEAMHQRTLGVLPNYYSSYIWNAAPLAPKQKLKLALYSTLDPASFVTAGISSGVEQAENTYPGYGQGAEGYGKRYGAALAGHLVSTLIGRAVLPSVFRQDPRYFYLGPGSSVSRRFGYALSRAVVARGDNGHWQPAYASVLGGFASGAVAYTYHPATDRGPYLIARNGLVQIGARAVTNLIREFVLRSVSTNVPDFEKGKPPPAPAGAVTPAPIAAVATP